MAGGWIRGVVVAATVALLAPLADGIDVVTERSTTRPYEMQGLERAEMTSFDGTVLRGWIAKPVLAPGEKAPTLLVASPYFGQVSAQPFIVRSPDDRRFDEVLWSYFDEWDKQETASAPTDAWTHSPGFPLIRLVRRGYAIALFNVRGTGRSEGCFEFGGPNEQRDQASLVEWLADQEWSNQKIAMAGHSYPAFTAMQAAVQRPPHLVATVTSGDVSDPFLLAYTPQGAASHVTATQLGLIHASNFLGLLTDQTDAPLHACPELLDAATRFPREYVGDERHAAFWDERRLVDRMHKVRSAALSADGFWDMGHGWQDSVMWEGLRHAPKRFVRGWWGHWWPIPKANDLATDDPDFTTLNRDWEDPNWEAIATRWLDYWTKGIGTPGRIDTIDVLEGGRVYELEDGWRAKSEVLYFDGPAQTFVDVPHPGERVFGARETGLPVGLPAMCPTRDPLASTAYAVYSTPPLAAESVIGGNSFAYLRLSVDAPHGMVSVNLAAVAPDHACDAAGQSADVSKVRWITAGAADLRFLASPYSPSAVAVGAPAQVRIDLADTFVRIPAGWRLVAAVGYGDVAFDRLAGPGQHPRITVHSDGGDHASHVVVPVYQGTLGGDRPRLDYPRRPFAPARYRPL